MTTFYVQGWCKSLETDLPAPDVKTKQRKEKKYPNNKDSSPAMHDSTTNQKEQKGPKETDSSQSSELDSLGKQKAPHKVCTYVCMYVCMYVVHMYVRM